MEKWYPKRGRVIFHVDMNSFYASVEAAHDPSLQGKPLAIAGNPEERRGIIVTSSYEARRKGVRTTMPLWQARRKCPELIVMPPNFARYRKASKVIFQLLATITEQVEPVSIDEGYLDVSNCQALGTPLQIAEDIQQRLLTELQLPCSIGIAPNKFLAKMASDMKKPLGITVLRKRDISHVLWPLPIEEMYGVGVKTAEKLHKIDVDTIGALAKHDPLQLKLLLGINGERLKQRALGNDEREVDPDAAHSFKSIGSSTTLRNDTTDEMIFRQVFRQLSEKVAQRLTDREVFARNIQLMIRYYDWHTITRSRQLPHVVYTEEELYTHAKQLFDAHWSGERVRLLGVTAHDLILRTEADIQLDLFTYKEWNEKR